MLNKDPLPLCYLQFLSLTTPYLPQLPPDSTFPTPYQTPDPEIAFGGPEMMDQWPTDIEDPSLQDNQSDPEDEDGGYHSNDLLKEMDGLDWITNYYIWIFGIYTVSGQVVGHSVLSECYRV